MIDQVAVLFSPGPFGGAEQIVLKSCSKLKGVLLILIKETRNPNPCDAFLSRCKELGVKTVVIPCRSQFDFNTLTQIKTAITEHKIKIVHSHGMKANFYNALCPVKRVSTQHGKTSHNAKVRLLEFIEHFALRASNYVVCVSEAMFNSASYKNKILINNFLSLTTRKTHYSTRDTIKLVAIGRLSPEKAINDAILAISELDNVELTIVGEGPQRSALESIASEKVVFVGFQQHIDTYLKASDALIMPSHREGLPMTLIEATAAGLPIIASNVGGIPALVHQNGYLFMARCIADIKAKILLFKDHRRDINAHAHSYAKVVQEHYSIDTWLNKTKALYESLL